MFVHDFTSVALPVDVAIRAFAQLTPETLGAIVAAAWNDEAPVLESVVPLTTVATGPVDVAVHGHRLRHDAAVVAIRWRGTGMVPSLDADLELVGFGRDCTHLHLMGRYELPSAIQRDSDPGSLVQRMMVVLVRNVLTDLGDALCRIPST